MSEQDADVESETASTDGESDAGQQSRDSAEEAPDDESAAEDRTPGGDESGETDAEEDVRESPTAHENLEAFAREPTEDIEEVLSALTESESATDEAGPEALVEAVEATPAETVAEGITRLRTELARLQDDLEAERERADDLESRLKRKQADFQNYKKRQQERMEEEKQRATEDLVSRLLDVRDNLQRALEQDADTDIRGGVESTLEQFNHELDKENVAVIEPDVGSEVDPRRHEVLATIASDQPEDTVADLHRPGYEMAGKVLRPAQVAVSDGSQHDRQNDDE